MRKITLLSAALLFWAGAAQAEELTCKGSITSIQGEGLVTRTHRFEVAEVTGTDLAAVLDKCRKIAQERQNRAAGKNPGVAFRKLSDVNLECSKGLEKIQVRRSMQTR